MKVLSVDNDECLLTVQINWFDLDLFISHCKKMGRADDAKRFLSVQDSMYKALEDNQ